MKHLAALLLILSTPAAFAASIPFTEKLEQALNTNGAILDSNMGGRGLKRVLRVVYDVSVDNGTSGTSLTPAKTAYLPAKAVVSRVTGYINTMFTGPSANRIRLMCGTSTEMDTQRNYRVLPAGTIFTNTTGADCGSTASAVTVLNTDAAATAGKAAYEIEYFVKE